MGKKIIVLLSIFLFLQTAISVGAVGVSTKEANPENNSHYKDIQITKSNGTYEVIGKAKVRKGIFYYMVENGHNVLVPEKKLDIHNLHWTAFKLKISIPKEKLPKNGAVILYLYEKDKSGNVIDQHPVILDKFKN